MSTICAEQQHNFHPSHQLLSPKNPHTLREIDIPPRKLLTRPAAAADMFSDDTILQKFLPSNDSDSDSDSDSDDPYSSDHFRMYEFKVRRCTRTRSHDWTDCPFAHPGEKARRRDPRRYHYSGTVCLEYRRGGCSRGDGCEFAHGVFECWLHPARYRTEACKDGKNCKRKVCFFAHTPRQLRILPVTSSPSNEFSYNNTTTTTTNNKLFLNHARSNNCCLFCHYGNNANGNSSTASPTSTLFGMSHFSPPASPPLSPLKPRNGAVSVSVSPVSRYGGAVSHHHHHNHNRYKDVLTELMGSFEGLNFNEGCCSPVSGAKAAPSNLAWLDVPALHNCEEQQQQFIVSSPSTSNNNSSSSFGCDEDQQQLTLSPSTIQNPTTISFKDNVNKLFFSHDNKVVGADVNNGSSCPAPDLGWVNELLM